MSAQTTQTTLGGDDVGEDAAFLSGLSYAVWRAAEHAPADASDRDVATVALDAHENGRGVIAAWRAYEEGGR